MIVTVELPDALFLELENLAEEMSLSRDDLYTLALEEYAKKRRDDLNSAKLDSSFCDP
ncbi:MAG: hypothetical protein H7095_04435 [Pseudopedobacter sp.]|nr:hypothetical protein [Deinococcales bacterium]